MLKNKSLDLQQEERRGVFDAAMAAIREGVDGYLLKPAEPEVLLTAVREALAQRQTRGAQSPGATRDERGRTLQHALAFHGISPRFQLCPFQ